METKKEAKEVCFICKRTSYITKCKGCIYNTLKKQHLSDNKDNNGNKAGQTRRDA